MLKWLRRFKVEKEQGHVVWVDLYEDVETRIQYFGLGNNIVPRYTIDHPGLYIGKGEDND